MQCSILTSNLNFLKTFYLCISMNNTLSSKHLSIEIEGEELSLLPEKAICWQSQKTLILSDMHLGKVGHFRKSGIPVPTGILPADLIKLQNIIVAHKPERLLILGDMFHSLYNQEIEFFRGWRNGFAELEILLVQGNHDIISRDDYFSLGIQITKSHIEGPFHFRHDPTEYPQGFYTISGHIHPGVRLSGKGRQSLRLPCFYFEERLGILPAFSRFTGMALINGSRKGNVYAILEDKVMEVK